ncbi:MAG: hypothetical protein IPH13_10925 [Planctomycetes bacterium]|nr:hypothetical protein [Planctomycetota bacterium]MCC7172341.1 hypothetical protein [Planctomycetota bacterium]
MPQAQLARPPSSTPESSSPVPRSRIARIWGWFRRNYAAWFSLIPIVGLATFRTLAARDVFGWNDEPTCKGMMEIVHPTILATLAVIAWVRCAVARSWIHGWLGALGTVLFCREIHFAGASIVLVGGGGVLAWLAWKHAARMAPLAGRRVVLSLFLTGFVCYAGSQILDRNVFKHVGRAVTSDKKFKLAYSSPMEECLEALGGACLLVASVMVRARSSDA